MTQPMSKEQAAEVLTEMRGDVNPEGADPYGHMMADALDLALSALRQGEGTVEGAILDADGGVSLIRKGTEDAWIAKRGGQRLYAHPPAQAFRTMSDDASIADYMDPLSLGTLTAVDQMALHQLMHDAGILPAQAATPSASEDGDPAEAAYWRFDARHKGYGQWKGLPMSERDAFKAEYRAALAAAPKPAADGVTEADSLLRDLGLDPDRFRTEGGFLNAGKIKAALLHPQDYEGLYLPRNEHQFLHSPKLGGELCQVCGAAKGSHRGTESCSAALAAARKGE